MKKALSLVLLMLGTLVFTGCGRGNSTGPSDVSGTFVDALVKGLNYSCSSDTNGTTDSNGEYSCKNGADVTFFIGTIEIGTIAAQREMITPYSLFPNDLTAAVNLARLLQSLDTDGNATNDLIDLNGTLALLLADDTNFTDPAFETGVETVPGITLPKAENAKQIMDGAIVAAGGTVTAGTHAPVAEAGGDQSINLGTLFTLDGSLSADADFDTLTYAWTVSSSPAGSTVTLSGETTVNPTFVAEMAATYILSLVVNDGIYNSAVDTVTIVVTPVKKTGQTISYDENGTVVTDLSNKDDGHYQTGVDSNYTRDNNTLVVTDHITRLEWQDDLNVSDPTKTKTWDEANTYCNGTGWRLPTRAELLGIVDYSGGRAATIDPVFENVVSNYYRSSTTYAGQNLDWVWLVNFDNGLPAAQAKTYYNYVRCVREGQ